MFAPSAVYRWFIVDVIVSVLVSAAVDRRFIGGVMVSVLVSSVVDRGFIGGVMPSTHVPNILSHGKPIQATANMISLVTSSPSQSGGQSPGHLLLHTSGGQTYYTGLNEQSLSSLRMLSHSKQTAHPIIQQLLRQPGMTSPRPLVNTTVSSTSQSKSCSIYFTMSVRL